MNINNKLLLVVTTLAATSLAADAAFTWTSITTSVNSNAEITTNGAEADKDADGFVEFGTGQTFTGNFAADGLFGSGSNPGNADPSIDTTINFNINVLGGAGAEATFRLQTFNNDFFRFDIVANNSVTGIDFDFDFATAIIGSDNPVNNLAGVFVLESTSASTIAYSVEQFNGDAFDLSGDDVVYRETATNNPDVGFSTPDSFSADGTTAFENVAGGSSTGLGFVAEDSTPETNFGAVSGSVTTDDGAAIGDGTRFLFTFNGDFNSVTVPEPASTAMLGLGLIGVALRRRRA